MWKVLTFAMVAVTVLAVVPPAGAFHGTPWNLSGTAVFKPTGQVWNMAIQWSGNGGVGGGSYRVTLSDPVSGVKMPAVTISGGEDISTSCCLWMSAGRCQSTLLETLGYNTALPYKGWDSQTGGKMLTFNGIQENCLNGLPADQNRYIHIGGSFLQHWTFSAAFGQPFGTFLENA